MLKVRYFNKNVSSENIDLITNLQRAKSDVEVAKSFFQNATDEKLIEYAIYLEKAAKERYDYYLYKAKEEGVSVPIESITLYTDVI